MAKTDPKTIDITLDTGDLIVNKETNNSGVLLAKHRLLRGTTENDRPSHEWAWTIKWSNEKFKTKKKYHDWVKSYACSESAIIDEIKQGVMEHYSGK